MGALVGLADYLSKLGFIPWFAKTIAGSIAGIPWLQAFLILTIVYLYAHYAFASLTAHITAMYQAFIAVAAAAGAPLTWLPWHWRSCPTSACRLPTMPPARPPFTLAPAMSNKVPGGGLDLWYPL